MCLAAIAFGPASERLAANRAGQTPNILTLRDQNSFYNASLKVRLEQIVPEIMREEGIDFWLVICRENNEDPVYRSLVPFTQDLYHTPEPVERALRRMTADLIAKQIGIISMSGLKLWLLVEERAAGSFYPPAVLDELDLPADLEFEGPLHVPERVHVLDFGFRPERSRAFPAHRNVRVAPEAPLLHVPVADAEVGDELAHPHEVQGGLARRTDIRLAHDLDQRHAAAVDVDEGIDRLVVD